MPVFANHDDEILIVFDRSLPFLLIDDDGTLGSGELESDMRVVPIPSVRIRDRASKGKERKGKEGKSVTDQ